MGLLITSDIDSHTTVSSLIKQGGMFYSQVIDKNYTLQEWWNLQHTEIKNPENKKCKECHEKFGSYFKATAVCPKCELERQRREATKWC